MANYIPLLPNLKEAGNDVKMDGTHGWKKQDDNFLDDLIKSLDVGGDIENIESIDSIPDPWARPLLFQMALFDKNGKEQYFVKGLHERIAGEWRALLAMVALKNYKRLDLRAEQVQLMGEHNVIADTLRKLSPAHSMSMDTGWENLYVISFNGNAIALASPLTFLCTAADYVNTFAGSIPKPWSANGFLLTDPIPYLSGEERSTLADWLHELTRRLTEYVTGREQNAQTKNVAKDILRCIDEYTSDVERGIQGRANCKWKENSMDMQANVYSCMNFSVKAGEASAEDSDVRLDVPQERRRPGAVLLCSPESLKSLAKTKNRPLTQIQVWQGVTANDVTEESLTGDPGRIGDLTLRSAEVRRPEDFFLDKITFFDAKNAVPKARKVRGGDVLDEAKLTVILPIKPVLLDFFTPRQIADRLSIDYLEDDGVAAVHFAFPMISRTGEKYEFVYEKTYSMKDSVEYMSKAAPAIEVWPDFKCSRWEKYYFYYRNADAKPAGQQQTEPGKGYVFVEPWSFETERSEDVPAGGLSNQYTAELSAFPEALCCSVNVASNALGTAVEAGIILLEDPETVEKNDLDTWDISVDFGTSSTMVYYSRNGKEPLPLAFEPHLYQVSGNDTLLANTYLEFIPQELMNKDGSFLSIFHLLNTKMAGKEMAPLKDGQIFQLTMERAEDFINEGSRVKSNLKWQGDSTGRYDARTYLEQLSMQSLAEAAAGAASKVRWHFSYPSAFSEDERESFQIMCRQTVTNACSNTGYDAGEDDIDRQTESVAAAYHFNRVNNSDTNFADGAICLDIGAGTTDISIVSGQPGQIVCHTSVRFAGRYLFDPIYGANNIFRKEPIELDGMTEDQRTTLLDADMRENSESYLHDLPNLTGRDEVRDVLQESQFALASLFWYVGQVLRELKSRGIYEEDHVPDIYVGGNGSRIFSWITGGSYDPSSVRLRVLKNIIKQSSGLDSDYKFTIFPSTKPKVEVASGMIEEKPHQELFDEEKVQKRIFGDTEDAYELAAVLCGEDCTSGGKEVGWNSMISARDIASGIEVDKMSMLRSFVDEFNKNTRSIWAEGIDFGDDLADDLQRKVRGFYADQRGRDIKEIRVEPVFIVAMQKLMEMLK